MKKYELALTASFCETIDKKGSAPAYTSNHDVGIVIHLVAFPVWNGAKRAVVPNTVCCFQRYSRGTVQRAGCCRQQSFVTCAKCQLRALCR